MTSCLNEEHLNALVRSRDLSEELNGFVPVPTLGSYLDKGSFDGHCEIVGIGLDGPIGPYGGRSGWTTGNGFLHFDSKLDPFGLILLFSLLKHEINC